MRRDVEDEDIVMRGLTASEARATARRLDLEADDRDDFYYVALRSTDKWVVIRRQMQLHGAPFPFI